MSNLWIVFACISALSTSLQELYVKKNVKQSSELIGFSTSIIGSIMFLVITIIKGSYTVNAGMLAIVTVTSVLLSTYATILKFNLIKTEEISMSVPFIGLVPVFMIFWAGIILKEFPKPLALIGVLIICLGAFLVNYKKGSIKLNKVTLIMLIVTTIYGFTTTLDKVAIDASSPYIYTLCWSILSSIAYFIVIKRKKGTKEKIVLDKHLIIQAIFWALGFLSIMIAVEFASSISSGTTYVKAISMLYIVMTTIGGSIIFKEKNFKNRSIAALIMFTGIVLLMLFK